MTINPLLNATELAQVTALIGVGRGIRGALNDQNPDAMITTQEVLLALLLWSLNRSTGAFDFVDMEHDDAASG
jgi:hypothetical protein